MSGERLYHGGVAGLRPGDTIKPTPHGRALDGCPICTARSQGLTISVDGEALDGPNAHDDAVYVTTDRLYAKHYASLARGDLYTVTAADLVPSEEDPLVPAFRCPTATVSTVVERAVRLTNGERRRLWRRMGGTSREWQRMVADLPRTMHRVADVAPTPAGEGETNHE